MSVKITIKTGSKVSLGVKAKEGISVGAKVPMRPSAPCPSVLVDVNGVPYSEVAAGDAASVEVVKGGEPVGALVDGKWEIPLEPLEGPYMAYGLRKLIPTYTGNAAVVRRDSDNATTDIGFDNNHFDVTAFNSFVGSGSGFVRNVYNQAETIFSEAFGSATLANQPRIITKGSRTVLEGRGALNANIQLTRGNEKIGIQMQLGALDKGFCISYVSENVNSNFSNYLMYSAIPLFILIYSNIDTFNFGSTFQSNLSVNVGSPTNLRHVLINCFPEGNYEIFINNVSIGTGSSHPVIAIMSANIMSGGVLLAEWQAWGRPLTNTEKNNLWTEIEAYYGL